MCYAFAAEKKFTVRYKINNTTPTVDSTEIKDSIAKAQAADTTNPASGNNTSQQPINNSPDIASLYTAEKDAVFLVLVENSTTGEGDKAQLFW